MLTDIEIAKQADIKPISDIAEKLGISADELEFYGKYKAKLPLSLLKKYENKEDGKLILVTAINPTPAGEGKTTVTVGLGEAMNRIGKKAVIALREPSMGPVFGIKGGAAGGGLAGRVQRDLAIDHAHRGLLRDIFAEHRIQRNVVLAQERLHPGRGQRDHAVQLDLLIAVKKILLHIAHTAGKALMECVL